MPLSNRTAFTLLEMLLTLSMCVVLMSLISGAMSFYVRDMSTAKDSFRQSQMATSILQMIEDDLRMTVTTTPGSTDGLAEVLSAAASPMAGLTGMTGGEEDLPEDAGLAEESASTEDESEIVAADSVDLALGGTVLTTPGLIGNTNQLQIDVSRLPSLEETIIDPTMAVSSGELLDRPSDIKTISYFVQPAGSGNNHDALERLAAAAGIPLSTNTADGDAVLTGGLVRRSIDRAIHVQAASTGGISRLSSSGEMIASEVTAISFEYFDGINWLPMINTDELGSLPPAVRVTLELNTRTFTHVVYLAQGQPAPETDSF